MTSQESLRVLLQANAATRKSARATAAERFSCQKQAERSNSSLSTGMRRSGVSGQVRSCLRYIITGLSAGRRACASGQGQLLSVVRTASPARAVVRHAFGASLFDQSIPVSVLRGYKSIVSLLLIRVPFSHLPCGRTCVRHACVSVPCASAARPAPLDFGPTRTQRRGSGATAAPPLSPSSAADAV